VADRADRIILLKDGRIDAGTEETAVAGKEDSPV
jgi:hypothetical protein